MKGLLLIISIFSYGVFYSQPLALPLSNTPSLAGNYAELRKNHFHMGLDFRTDNKENLNVIAAEDGYVSRILISHNGYGKALYINHPKLGITTVYAHLNEFKFEIEQWVNQVQYAQYINTIDTVLPANLFTIKKGETIAFSGNTGSSSGPHLHFEVRNLFTERTINPLHFYPQIRDNIAPSLNKIIFYAIQENSNFLSAHDPAKIKNQTLTLSSDKIGTAVAAQDRMNGSPNVFGIYALNIYVDNQLHYRFKLDSLDFGWQSHIKAASDYGLPYSDIVKGFYLPCSFNLTDSSSQNGVITLRETKEIRVEIYDFAGNKSTCQFTLDYNGKENFVKPLQYCSTENFIAQQDFFKIIIPPYGIADNMAMRHLISKNISANELLRVDVFKSTTPVLKPYQFIYTGKYNEDLRDKIYLESRVDNKHKAYIGSWSGGRLTFPKVKNFGTMLVKYDTKAPTIGAKPYKTSRQLIFIAEDKESEIDSYLLWVDGKWRKLYYDAKTDRLIYNILNEDKGKKVKALLEVTDRVGNKNSKVMEILL